MEKRQSRISLPAIEDMTLEEKIGQLLVTGFSEEQMDDSFINLVKQEKIGNVILFQENIKSRGQLRDLCRDMRERIVEETGIPPFITIDEEGGIVSRITEDMGRMPSAMAMAVLGREKVYEAARISGEMLKALGINFNLAPVLDVNSNAYNPVIGIRSYGQSGKEAWDMASAAMEGYMDAGIMCSGKHFPGHGDTDTDSHLALPVIKKTRSEMEETELYPFRRAVEAGIPAITIAHIVFEKEDSLPATMSKKIVTGLLKEELGFEGLVISDCMEMNAISKTYGIPEGCVQALNAGIDLIFISHIHEEVKNTVQALKREVLSGRISMERLNQAVSKILYFKERYGILPVQEEEDVFEKAVAVSEEFYRQVVEKGTADNPGPFTLGERPCFISPAQSRVSLVSNAAKHKSFAQEMRERLGGTSVDISLSPDEKEIKDVLAVAGEASSIVFGSLNGSIYKGQEELIKRLMELSIPMALATLRNPFELRGLPERIFRLPLYEYTERAARTAADFFVP